MLKLAPSQYDYCQRPEQVMNITALVFFLLLLKQSHNVFICCAVA